MIHVTCENAFDVRFMGTCLRVIPPGGHYFQMLVMAHDRNPLSGLSGDLCTPCARRAVFSTVSRNDFGSDISGIELRAIHTLAGREGFTGIELPDYDPCYPCDCEGVIDSHGAWSITHCGQHNRPWQWTAPKGGSCKPTETESP